MPCRSIDAATALQWGLVNRVVPAAQLDEPVTGLARAIASKSQAVIGLGKAAFYRQIEQGMESAYALTGQTMACNLELPDAAEGMAAFIEKRKPHWK